MTDPRNISPRSDAFLSIIGPRISAIEHHLHNAPFLVKGLDIPGRDVKMRALLDYDTYVETDYSRFDMTISLDWISCVQDRILMAFFPDDLMFAQALMLARKTKGVSGNGLLYNVVGTRCSGDAHTSIANGLINAFNTQIVFRDIVCDTNPLLDGVLSEGPMVSWHEGDDGVVALTKQYSHLSPRLDLLDTFGFVVKSFVTRDLNLVSFCGRYMATDGMALHSYCDPMRTLSKLHITLSQGKLDRLLFAKMMSYAHTDGSTPIIGVVSSVLARAYQHLFSKSAIRAAVKDRYVLRDVKTVFNWQSRDVNPTLRAPFAMRTGISPSEQIRLEEYYSTVFSQGLVKEFVRMTPSEDLVTGLADREVFFSPSVHVM
jgi:hypothetical protein